MSLEFSSMRMPTLKIDFISRTEYFYLYKTEDGYAVIGQFGYILKKAKTVKTCERYIQKQLESRRAAERYAIEKINQDQDKNRAI
jgi:hypothetical protein